MILFKVTQNAPVLPSQQDHERIVTDEGCVLLIFPFLAGLTQDGCGQPLINAGTMDTYPAFPWLRRRASEKLYDESKVPGWPPEGLGFKPKSFCPHSSPQKLGMPTGLEGRTLAQK